MRFRIRGRIAFAAAILLTAGASAQDSGEFRFVFGGQRDYTTVEHPDKTVTVGEIHGLWVVTEGDDAGPFVDEAILHGGCAVHVTTPAGGASSIAADCTLEDEEHDALYLVGTRRGGDVATGGGGDGVFTLSSGTGKFQGIGGVCPYTVHYMEDDDLVVFARCEWTKN